MPNNLEDIASQLAPKVAKLLNQSANNAATEADFRREAAKILEDAGTEAGLIIIPRDEFSVARGRVDSVYNRLILEYKKPGKINGSNSRGANKEIIEQVKDYILDVAKKEKREAYRLAGVALDGYRFIFVRRVGEGWAVDEPISVNKPSTELFLRLLFSLSSGAALVPENLVQDFGPKHMRTQSAVRSLYRAFKSSKSPLVIKLFEQWRQFFSEATDYKEWSEKIESKPEFRSFVKSLWTSEEIKHLDAASVFFVLHTYYALLIKLIATMAAARFAGGKVAALSKIAVKEGEDLKHSFIDLERGGLFREYGIRNFLEGDFFGWYLAAWNHDIEDAIGTLTKRLAEYDPGTLELAPENARDLLKKLYHYLLPREIRHDLGEYYTPDWLAERLCIQTLGSDLGDPRKRVLDPACGSGTFIVILIKYIKEWANNKNWEPAKTLKLILQNIVGFDLNPLAVIAARTNYLLALGDLLKARAGDIDIPIYQADSVLTPSQGTGLFEGNIYPLKTSVGVFRIPAVFAEREQMDTLTNSLDESMEAGLSVDTFIEQIRERANFESKLFDTIESDLKLLFKQLRDLHDQGLNGVWARIIKNSFAPVFIEPCNYIIGNPPWVNWQNLPDDYRDSTIPLWHYYGMVPEGGLHSILGKVKMDISMLMTYVSVHRYLQKNGRLGFVLSQSLFKASAGQRFRRFELADKTPFGPTIVEDMFELNPFEGATNRTVVAVFVKNHNIRYPLSYSYWKRKKTGRNTVFDIDTPLEEIEKEKVSFINMQAIPISDKDVTSSWITARPKVLKAIRKILGNSPYQAHEGVNTGGANAVFWLEIIGKRPGGTAMISNITEGAKRKVQNIQSAVETDLLYPLLRGRDVSRWSAIPSASILITRRPGVREKAISLIEMQKQYPKTFSYLSKFQNALLARRDAVLMRSFKVGTPFYAIGALNDYTFSKWKIVWRYIATEMTCAVVGPYEHELIGTKVVIPDCKLMLVNVNSKSEAYYLCGVLNSNPVKVTVNAYAVGTQISTHVLNNINVPKFSAQNQIHMNLADLTEEAHKAIISGKEDNIFNIEEKINKYAAKLWGLNIEELADIRQTMETI